MYHLGHFCLFQGPEGSLLSCIPEAFHFIFDL